MAPPGPGLQRPSGRPTQAPLAGEAVNRPPPDRIEVVAHDPAWTARFADLGRDLRAGWATSRSGSTTSGYVYRADNPERTKRYFREPPGRPRTHVHVRRAGSFSEQWALLFRDYLRAHAEVAAEYAALKRRLAARLRDDRRAYLDAKGPFLWEVMRLADGWAQAEGWHPGPSDA